MSEPTSELQEKVVVAKFTTTTPYGVVTGKINGGHRHVSFQINLCPGVKLPEGGVDPEASSGGGAAE